MMNVLIELSDDEHMAILKKKSVLRLTWKEILMKGADNL